MKHALESPMVCQLDAHLVTFLFNHFHLMQNGLILIVSGYVLLDITTLRKEVIVFFIHLMSSR